MECLASCSIEFDKKEINNEDEELRTIDYTLSKIQLKLFYCYYPINNKT